MTSCSSSQNTTSESPSSGGCCGHTVVFDGASVGYRRALMGVIAINLVGFAVVAVGGLMAGSASLAANTLDFAADAATYAISLWAIGKSVQVRAGAALIKSGSLALMAAGILGFAIWRAVTGALPEAGVISGLGLFGAAANLLAALLLVRYRNGDANVRSVWLCSRNDAIGNIAVLCAAGLVAVTATRWADLAVAAIMASLFLSTAWQITRQARRELQAQAT